MDLVEKAKRLTSGDPLLLLPSKPRLNFDKKDLGSIELSLKSLEQSHLKNPQFERGEYLSQAPPTWYATATTPALGPKALDFSSEYLQQNYWQGQTGNGMPTSDLFWSLRAMDSIPSLTSLVLTNCNIGDSGLAAVALLLKENTTIQHLNLTHNSLTSPAIIAFINMLSIYNFSLLSLDINESAPSFDYTNGKLLSAIPKDSEPRQVQYQAALSTFLQINSSISKLIEGTSKQLDLDFNNVRLNSSRLDEMLARVKPNLETLTIKRFHPWVVSDSIIDSLVHLHPTAFNVFPSEIASLSHLTTLIIKDCVLPQKSEPNTLFKSFPRCIGALFQLRILVINRVGLEEVDDSKKQSLKVNNFVSEGSILTSLTNLELLDLSDNRLTRIPDSIAYCTKLKQLILNQNRLETLPPAILMLTGLTSLRAMRNRLSSYPLSLKKYCCGLEDLRILNQGASGKECLVLHGSIVSAEALKDLKQQEQDADLFVPFSEVAHRISLFWLWNASENVKLNRYKLVFVGDGNVGKTTTTKNLKRIAASKQHLSEESSLDNIATDGIDISSLAIVDKAGNSRLFSLWDFAGQDIYSYSHTFFLTRHSIYLIMYDCSEGTGKSIERVEYWIQVVRTRFPGSRCLVIGTHIDEVKPKTLTDLKERIMARFNLEKDKRKSVRHTSPLQGDPFRVENVIFISNKTDKGIPELVDELARIPELVAKEYKTAIPLRWILLEEHGKALSAQKKIPVLDWQEWCAIAKECEIEEVELKDATKHCHEVGSILWFDEESLRDKVYLCPNFLTDVFSAVISAKINLSQGILRHDLLPTLWKGVPMTLFPGLINILAKFEVIHPLDPAFLLENPLLPLPGPGLSPHPQCSVIPALLPDKPPEELLRAAWPPLATGQREYVRSYTFEFIPNGFFSRLSIRLLQSRWKTTIFWKSGIILFKPLARVSLDCDIISRTIRLRVRGPEFCNRIGALIDSISMLIDDWLPNSTKTIAVPYTLDDGVTVVNLDLKDMERKSSEGVFYYPIPGHPQHPSVRMDQVAPEFAVLMSDSKVFEYSEIAIDRMIGSGGFGQIHLGRLRSSGQLIACKSLKNKQELLREGVINEALMAEADKEFRREIFLHRALVHPNLIRLLGVCMKPSITMVLEFVNCGDLSQFLHGNGSSIAPAVLTTNDRFVIALGVARGMQCLHNSSPPIIHRDLKTPNILMHRDPSRPGSLPVPKIADFGLSRSLDWSPFLVDRAVENPRYLAPEILERKVYTEKVDVYAFGLVLFEIATGVLAFETVHFWHDMERRVLAGQRPTIPPSTDPALSKLIQQCWAQAWEARPSFNQIVAALTQKSHVVEKPDPPLVNFGSGWSLYDNSPKAPLASTTPAELGLPRSTDRLNEVKIGSSPRPLPADSTPSPLAPPRKSYSYQPVTSDSSRPPSAAAKTSLAAAKTAAPISSSSASISTASSPSLSSSGNANIRPQPLTQYQAPPPLHRLAKSTSISRTHSPSTPPVPQRLPLPSDTGFMQQSEPSASYAPQQPKMTTSAASRPKSAILPKSSLASPSSASPSGNNPLIPSDSTIPTTAPMKRGLPIPPGLKVARPKSTAPRSSSPSNAAAPSSSSSSSVSEGPSPQPYLARAPANSTVSPPALAQTAQYGRSPAKSVSVVLAARPSPPPNATQSSSPVPSNGMSGAPSTSFKRPMPPVKYNP